MRLADQALAQLGFVDNDGVSGSSEFHQSASLSHVVLCPDGPSFGWLGSAETPTIRLVTHLFWMQAGK